MIAFDYARSTNIAARNQILGGVVWGIGMALQEETLIDHRFGRMMNANLADYHVPVNAVYHATGVRVRKLPITLDKLL